MSQNTEDKKTWRYAIKFLLVPAPEALKELGKFVMAIGWVSISTGTVGVTALTETANQSNSVGAIGVGIGILFFGYITYNAFCKASYSSN